MNTAKERYEQQQLECALYWRYELSRLDEEVVAAIVSILKITKSELVSRLATENNELLQVTDWNKKRMAELNLWLDEILTGAKVNVASYIEAATLQAAEASLAAWYNIISLGGASDVIETVGFTVEQLQSWTSKSIVSGSVLSQWVDNAFSVGAKQKLYDSIIQSGIEGKGIASTVKKLQENALVQGISITQREAITLARTYIQIANVGAMADTYKANESLFSGYEWCATLDNRTCKVCASLDGKVFATLEQVPIIPRHARCRCVIIPKLKSFKALGIPLDELDTVERAWNIREGKANIDAGSKAKIVKHGTTTANFSGWWYTLSPAEQAQSVGTVRANLLRNGELTWDDLADKDGNFYPLDSLGYSRSGEKL